MNLPLGAAILFSAVAIAAPGRAETPLTPSRPNPPTAAAQPWVEPPSAPQAVRAAPAATASEPGPGSQQVTTTAPQAKRRHYARRAVSRDHMARLLNRRELGRVYYGSSMSYYGGWGPNPYSTSGP